MLLGMVMEAGEMPYKHINAAAQAAKPGDEVLVAPGIYREYVDFQNGDSLSMPTSKGKIPMKRKWRSMCAACSLSGWINRQI